MLEGKYFVDPACSSSRYLGGGFGGESISELSSTAGAVPLAVLTMIRGLPSVTSICAAHMLECSEGVGCFLPASCQVWELTFELPASRLSKGLCSPGLCEQAGELMFCVLHAFFFFPQKVTVEML